MSFDLQLTDLRALVTGGTRGIGAAVVNALDDAGAHVVATARSNPSKDDKRVRVVTADLATAEGCAATARVALQLLGGIDILINTLGGSSAPAGGFAALDDGEWFKELNQI